jgi:hypothetical protein
MNFGLTREGNIFFINFFFSPIQGPEDTEERARMDPEEAALRYQESYPDSSL